MKPFTWTDYPMQVKLQTEMVHTHRQCGEEGATAPLKTQDAKEIWLNT
jgi:hypothetical protein